MPSTTTTTSSPLQKWHIALGLGAVGAVGVGYWYLKSGRKSNLKDTQDAISIDESSKPSEDLTPLKHSQNFKSEGNTLFKSGKYDEAINMYNKAIEICPEDLKADLAIYYQNRAAAYEQLKKWSAVISDCTKAIELNSRYEKAFLRRAKAAEMIKDLESSLDDITCVCLLQGFKNESALFMADRVLKALGKKHAVEAMKTKKMIIPSKTFVDSYFSSFSCDPVYQKLIEVGDPLGQGELGGFTKAKLAFATGKFEEIIPACTDEINMTENESPYMLEALSLRGSFYSLTGLFPQAFADLGTLIDTEEADVKIRVNALIKRASIYMQNEKVAECLEDFDKAAELGPEISDVFHHRGQVELLREKTKEARADFEKAVSLNPNFAIAFVQKCYADYRYAMQIQDAGLLMKSLSDFKKGIERFPKCSETYVLYAQVLTEKQNFEEADKLYEKALEIDSKNAAVYVHKGLLHLQWKADINEAIRLLKESIRVDDKCQFAYETLGTVEVQRGNLILAIDLFNKAIELSRTEMEMTHLFSLRDAAVSQHKVTTRLGVNLLDIHKLQL